MASTPRKWILVGAAIACVALHFWLLGEREPEYQGKKLSEWISHYRRQNGNNLGTSGGAAEAIHNLGASAVPWLLIKGS